MLRSILLALATLFAVVPLSAVAQSWPSYVLLHGDEAKTACDITADTPGIYDAYLIYYGVAVTEVHFDYRPYVNSSPSVLVSVSATHGITWSGGGDCSSGCTFVNLYGCELWPGEPSLVATLHLDLTAGVPDCGELVLLGPTDYTGQQVWNSLEVAICENPDGNYAPANQLAIHKTGVACACGDEPLPTSPSTWGRVKALYR